MKKFTRFDKFMFWLIGVKMCPICGHPDHGWKLEMQTAEGAITENTHNISCKFCSHGARI